MGIGRFGVVDLERSGNEVDYDEMIEIGIRFVGENEVIDR